MRPARPGVLGARPGTVIVALLVAAGLLGVTWFLHDATEHDGAAPRLAVADDPVMSLPESMLAPDATRIEITEQPLAELAPEIVSDEVPPTSELATVIEQPCKLMVQVVLDDSSGTPAGGAFIDVGHMVETPGSYDGTDWTYQRHVTDESGRLELATSCGATSVSAWRQDQASDTTHIELHALDGDGARAVELVLKAGMRLEGRVVNGSTQQPIAGVEVWIPTFNAGDRALTDELGRYVYPRHPATRSYGRSVKARREGFGDVQRTIVINTLGDWSIPAVNADFDSFEDQATTSGIPIVLDFELFPQVSYRGRVIDTSGAPVASAAINARGYYASGSGIFSPDTGAAVTDSDGFFHLDGLRAGTAHTLWYRAEGYGTALRHSFPETRANGDLGVTVLSAASTLTLRLTDTESLPAMGFTIKLLWEDPQPPVVPERSEVGSLIFAPYKLEEQRITDSDGVARFEDLPAGTYHVTSHKPRRKGQALIDEELRLDLGDNRQLNRTLPANTVTVRGVVTRLGQPVEGAEVSAAAPQSSIGPVLTDAGGRFALAGQWREKETRLEVSWRDPANGSSWEGYGRTDALEEVTVELEEVEVDDEG